MRRAPPPPTTPPMMAFLLPEPPIIKDQASLITILQNMQIPLQFKIMKIFDAVTSYIAIHLEKKKKDLHQNSPLPKKELISVVWLSAKKGLSEYLKKHPASTALPSPLGTQTCMLLDATFKQF